ncbi:MAG: TetR/AcrR family transcriptional regulator [Thermoanaerobaculia bacterium]|nr:TetR/AcrR family transcriptional regulator [Thermoanaerobaculia bacterium]
METPSTHSTHDRLRAVALELFAERGYGGASMAEIARGVGVQKATLYNYYASKEALLLDLLKRGLDAWRESSQGPLTEEGLLRERLRRHLEAVLIHAVEHPHEASVVRVAATQIGGELGFEVRRQLAQHKLEYSKLLERLFAEAIDRGEVRVADPRDLSRVWRALLNGLLVQHLFEGGGEVLEHFDGLWNILWNGLAAEEKRS